MNLKKILLKYPTQRERLKTKRYKQYLDREAIFIHIPKAAGSSVNMSLYGNLGLGHMTARGYIKAFGYKNYMSMYKFTFVRNPYSRVQSAYNFLKKGGMNSYDNEFAQKYINQYKDINDFIINGLDKVDNIKKWIHFRPQYEFIEYYGKNVVDFIGKIENIDKDYQYIMNVLGIKNGLTTHNKLQNKNDEFMKYFNEESKKIIYKIYRKDFEKFNYMDELNELREYVKKKS